MERVARSQEDCGNRRRHDCDDSCHDRSRRRRPAASHAVFEALERIADSALRGRSAGRTARQRGVLEGLGDQEHPSTTTAEGHALGRGAPDQLRPLSGPDRRCAGSQDDALLVVDVELEVDSPTGCPGWHPPRRFGSHGRLRT